MKVLEKKREEEEKFQERLRRKASSAGPQPVHSRVKIGDAGCNTKLWFFQHFMDCTGNVYIYNYAQRLGFAQALQRRGSPFRIILYIIIYIYI